MDDNRDPMIIKHLENLIQDLERKFAYPKNDWRRREQLQKEIQEAKQRLETVARSNRRSSRDRSYSRSQRASTVAAEYRDETDLSTPSENSRPKKLAAHLLDVSYH